MHTSSDASKNKLLVDDRNGSNLALYHSSKSHSDEEYLNDGPKKGHSIINMETPTQHHPAKKMQGMNYYTTDHCLQ